MFHVYIYTYSGTQEKNFTSIFNNSKIFFVTCVSKYASDRSALYNHVTVNIHIASTLQKMPTSSQMTK